jgi:hypothetical protein
MTAVAVMDGQPAGHTNKESADRVLIAAGRHLRPSVSPAALRHAAAAALRAAARDWRLATTRDFLTEGGAADVLKRIADELDGPGDRRE